MGVPDLTYQQTTPKGYRSLRADRSPGNTRLQRHELSASSPSAQTKPQINDPKHCNKPGNVLTMYICIKAMCSCSCRAGRHLRFSCMRYDSHIQSSRPRSLQRRRTILHSTLGWYWILHLQSLNYLFYLISPHAYVFKLLLYISLCLILVLGVFERLRHRPLALYQNAKTNK